MAPIAALSESKISHMGSKQKLTKPTASLPCPLSSYKNKRLYYTYYNHIPKLKPLNFLSVHQYSKQFSLQHIHKDH